MLQASQTVNTYIQLISRFTLPKNETFKNGLRVVYFVLICNSPVQIIRVTLACMNKSSYSAFKIVTSFFSQQSENEILQQHLASPLL